MICYVLMEEFKVLALEPMEMIVAVIPEKPNCQQRLGRRSNLNLNIFWLFFMINK